MNDRVAFWPGNSNTAAYGGFVELRRSVALHIRGLILKRYSELQNNSVNLE